MGETKLNRVTLLFLQFLPGLLKGQIPLQSLARKLNGASLPQETLKPAYHVALLSLHISTFRSEYRTGMMINIHPYTCVFSVAQVENGEEWTCLGVQILLSQWGEGACNYVCNWLIRNFATYRTLTTSRKHFEYSHYIVLEKHNLLSSTDFGRKALSTLGNCCIVEEQAEHYISVVKKTRKVVY